MSPKHTYFWFRLLNCQYLRDNAIDTYLALGLPVNFFPGEWFWATEWRPGFPGCCTDKLQWWSSQGAWQNLINHSKLNPTFLSNHAKKKSYFFLLTNENFLSKDLVSFSVWSLIRLDKNKTIHFSKLASKTFVQIWFNRSTKCLLKVKQILTKIQGNILRGNYAT